MKAKAISIFLAGCLLFSGMHVPTAFAEEPVSIKEGSEAGPPDGNAGEPSGIDGSEDYEGDGKEVPDSGSGIGDPQNGSLPEDGSEEGTGVGSDSPEANAEDEPADDAGLQQEDVKEGKDPADPKDTKDDEESGKMDLLAASDVPLADGVYVIRTALAPTRVVEVASSSMANSANVQLYESNMTDTQKFKITRGSDGYYTISNVNSGKVLTVAGGVAKPRTNIEQYTNNSTNAQKWAIVKNSDTSFTLKSKLGKNLVVDISGSSTANRANVQAYTSNGTNAQKFYFLPVEPQTSGEKTVDDGVYEIITQLDGKKCLDVYQSNQVNGATVQLYGRNGTFAQKFMITYQQDGFYSIRALHSGKALDVEKGNLVPTTKVQQWGFSGGNSQKWAIKENGDGSYTLISKSNGLVLDLARSSTSNGARIQTYTANGTNAQKWSLKKTSIKFNDGVYEIAPLLDNAKRIDVPSSSTADGAGFQVYRNNGTNAQKYLITAVSGTSDTYTIESVCSGKLLTGEGNTVVQRKPKPSKSQQWKVSSNPAGGACFVNVGTGKALCIAGGKATDRSMLGTAGPDGKGAQGFIPISTQTSIPLGYYCIASAVDGRVVDVASSSVKSGAKVQVHPANNTGAQRFILQDAGAGWFYIVNANSQKVLDVYCSGTAAGTKVQQWTLSKNKAQKWKAEYAGGGSYRIVSACGNMSLSISSGGSLQIDSKRDSANQKWKFQAKSSWPSGNSDLDWRLNSIMMRLGTDGDIARKAFNHVAYGYSYRSGSKYPTGNWSIPFAIEMHAYGSGNCYRFAALYCWLLKSAGYNANVVSGWVPTYGGGQAPHGWVEVYINGNTYICDPDMAHESPGRNWYMVTYANAPTEYHRW